ncbi:MAG: murein L,D-transpeptidase, partial [Thermoanaerobaculia bacterium]
RTVYGPYGFSLLWTRNGRPTPQAQAAIAAFENAAAKGLDATDYDAGQWTARVASLRSDADLARFDVALTTSLLRYASDVRNGRVHPHEVSFALDVEPKKFYAPALGAQIATSTDATPTLASLEPQHDEYRRLLTALATYRQLESQSKNDQPLPVVTKLSPEQTYDALPQLAAKLRLYGDLDANATVEGNVYTGAIVDAVKHFQARHGLGDDGVIGKTTFAALNTPVSRRIEQIEMALERWRWMPAQLDEQTILVNIPEFRLHARDAKTGETLSMRVVVGKAAGHKTPVFEGDIKHVVFRPYWNVTPNIQRSEIAPKLESDPNYLARNDYELLDAAGRVIGTHVDAETIRRVRNNSLRVRQKPGRSNALGLVKFLFPNDNNVYLHSTPQQSLFARARRDFSHGCIRVEDPVALAAWALRNDPRWDREKIEKAMKGDRDDIYVKIDRPINVKILYATAAVDANGTVQFFDDIYGHDTQLAKVLEPQQQGAAVMLAAK